MDHARSTVWPSGLGEVAHPYARSRLESRLQAEKSAQAGAATGPAQMAGPPGPARHSSPPPSAHATAHLHASPCSRRIYPLGNIQDSILVPDRPDVRVVPLPDPPSASGEAGGKAWHGGSRRLLDVGARSMTCG